MTKIKKIKFRDEEYWLVPSDFCEGNICPLDQFTEDGEMLANPFRDISYAIIEDGGKIMRFGQQIGTIKDIEEINE
jgi:hypothetical protein